MEPRVIATPYHLGGYKVSEEFDIAAVHQRSTINDKDIIEARTVFVPKLALSYCLLIRES